MKFKIIPFYILLLFAIGCHRNPVSEASVNPLERLVDGNKRFTSGHATHPDETLERVKALQQGQKPFAVIVSCSDSRVSPEVIFDQGLGDLFVIRTAGHVIGDFELGSIEYAVEHLHCNLVVVLGHENCGAVKAFLEHTTESSNDHIEKIVEYLDDEDEQKQIPNPFKKDTPSAVKANILHGVHLIKNSEPILSSLTQQNKIEVVGALYHLDNGQITFLNNSVE